MDPQAIRDWEETQLRAGGGPAKLFFFAAARGLAAAHLRTSLVAGVPVEQLQSLTGVYPELLAHADGGRVYAWGARPGDLAEQKWERLNAGDICVVYTGERRFGYWGRVYAKVRSERIARSIWSEDEDGAIWACMYFLDR